MKIGMIFDDEFPPHPRIWNEAFNLMEAGHEVYLYCFDYKGRPKHETLNNLKIIRSQKSRLIRKLSALAYTTSLYHRIIYKDIAQFVKSYGIEIIHVHNIRVARAVLYASPNVKMKILDLHENIPEIMKSYNHVTSFPGKYFIFPSIWKKWERRFVLDFDKIIVVTEFAKNDLLENYQIDEKKVIVVPNSVQESFYKSIQLNNDIITRFSSGFNVLYFGDTGIRRGLETVIRAAEVLKNSIPNIQIIIVGSSTSDDYLKHLTSKLKLDNQICFEGFQDEKLLQSYITTSNVCISPLLRNRHHDTTYANKIFQYMALGKPLLVSDCTAQQEIVNRVKCGLIHKAGNINDFVKKLRWMYENPNKTSEMGLKGQAFIANEFNQKKQSKEMIDFYNNLN